MKHQHCRLYSQEVSFSGPLQWHQCIHSFLDLSCHHNIPLQTKKLTYASCLSEHYWEIRNRQTAKSELLAPRWRKPSVHLTLLDISAHQLSKFTLHLCSLHQLQMAGHDNKLKIWTSIRQCSSIRIVFFITTSYPKSRYINWISP